MDVVVTNRGVVLEFAWKDWVKLRVTLMKMTFDPDQHSKHMSPEYKATTLYRYSNLLGFSVVCIIYSGYDIDGEC